MRTYAIAAGMVTAYAVLGLCFLAVTGTRLDAVYAGLLLGPVAAVLVLGAVLAIELANE